MRNPRSAYVRRKQAKGACPGCGWSNVEAIVYGAGTWFRCRACKGVWVPGMIPFESPRERLVRIFGVEPQNGEGHATG